MICHQIEVSSVSLLACCCKSPVCILRVTYLHAYVAGPTTGVLYWTNRLESLCLASCSGQHYKQRKDITVQYFFISSQYTAFWITWVQALKEAGCDEVVLAINYRPQVGSCTLHPATYG